MKFSVNDVSNISQDVLEFAQYLAIEHHSGQVNKHDGEPYLLHVARVAQKVRHSGYGWVEQSTAWLHDIVEDTSVTIKIISIAFPEEIALAVDAITKIKGQSNEDYYTKVSLNPIAKAVKIADIHDNFGRNHLIADEQTRLRMAHKYSLGLSILTGVDHA